MLSTISRFRSYLAGPGLGPLLIKTVTGSAGLRIVGMGFGFLVGVQLARGLGAEGYGIYGVAMSVIALLTVPAEFGLPQLLTREVAAAQVRQDWSLMKGVIRWSTQVSLQISALVAAGIVIWLGFSSEGFSSSLGKTLLAGIVMVPLVALLSLRSATLRGLQHIVKGQLPDALLRPAFFSLALFIAYCSLGPFSPAVAMWLGALSVGAVLLITSLMVKRYGPRELKIAQLSNERDQWLSASFPMALTEGMRVLQGHIGVLFLSFLSTMNNVGLYRVASSIVLLVGFSATLFNIVSSPLISRLYAAADFYRLQILLSRVAIGMLLGAVLLTVPFVFVGEALLGRMFGEEFIDSQNALMILCVGSVINSAFGANAVLLNMTGHSVQVTRASVASLLSLMIFAPPLIVFFGVEGAAGANVGSLLIWRFLMWRDARRLLNLDPSVFFCATPLRT